MGAPEITATLRQSLADGSFVKLSLADYKGDEADLKQIHVRRITVKRAEKLGFTYRYKTRDIAKNYDVEEGLDKIDAALHTGFRRAALFTTAFDLTLENGKVRKSAATETAPPDTAHDHQKSRAVKATGQSWLHDLNITDATGKIHDSAQDKYRQINRYVELLAPHVAAPAGGKTLRVADMGAGKGYLTFALYDYLHNTLKIPAAVTGVEYRPDLVALCNDIATRTGFSGLSFTQGTIDGYDATGTDILIALHACDTATDDAIAKGIGAGAGLIVVAPCCHKQIRREMERGNGVAPDLPFLLRHGIFMERQAEMVTDGLRALLLEYTGYNVKVFEFISDAHTPKNVMIVAAKNPRAKANDPAALQKIRAAMNYFGITHHHLADALGVG
jgi:SAM-dependent methyltransferase